MMTEAMRTQKRWVRIWAADMAISSYISVHARKDVEKGLISDVSTKAIVQVSTR